MPKYVFSLDASKVQKTNKLVCLFCATECPVLEVKGKLKGSPPSDIINRLIKRVYRTDEKSRIRPRPKHKSRVVFLCLKGVEYVVLAR